MHEVIDYFAVGIDGRLPSYDRLEMIVSNYVIERNWVVRRDAAAAAAAADAGRA